MIAGNELQGVQALWCKARWWMSRVGHGLSRAAFPRLPPSLPCRGSMLISRVTTTGRDVGPFPKSTEALRHSSPAPRATFMS